MHKRDGKKAAIQKVPSVAQWTSNVFDSFLLVNSFIFVPLRFFPWCDRNSLLECLKRTLYPFCSIFSNVGWSLSIRRSLCHARRSLYGAKHFLSIMFVSTLSKSHPPRGYEWNSLYFGFWSKNLYFWFWKYVLDWPIHNILNPFHYIMFKKSLNYKKKRDTTELFA